MAQGKTSVYTQDNGVKVQFQIDTYAIRVLQEVIDVYYVKQFLAPVTEEVIEGAEKQMTYRIEGEEFHTWRTTLLSALVAGGVSTVEDMFFLSTLPKIISQNGLNEPAN